MTENDVIEFVKANIHSVWALELLLLLRRDPARKWPIDALIRELRSSGTAVHDALTGLELAGLVTRDGDAVSYRSSPGLDELTAETSALYAVKPVLLVKAIMSAPNDKLRLFANSFKLKE